ncbi:MAG TPA: FAD-dependent monooxygenase [Polyangiaceae bacterium]
MERFDVVIVGGGFAGLVTAAALADGRRRIAVLEARDAIQNRFSGELIHPSGVSVLGRLGLLDRLRETTGGATVRGFVVAIDGDGDAVIPYERVLGFSCNHVAMVETIRPEVEKRTGVTMRRGVRVRDVLRSESGRVAGVRTEEGEEIHASLVVVADGRHSKLRNVIGLSAETELLSFTAAPLVSASVLPQQGHGHIFVGAWGPILAYPTEHGRARMCIDLPTDTDRRTVRERIRTMHAPFLPPGLRSALLDALEEEDLEICATHRVHTRRCALPGVVMVGDAAGCCHPLTAAGMSVALHDAETLAHQLDTLDPPRAGAQADRSLDLGLLRYQEERYAFVRAREHLTDALYEVFRGNDEPSRAVGLGLLRAWREDDELRRGSMALLAGLESRPGAFVGAFLRVAGRSTKGVLTGQFGEPSLRGRTKALVGLAKLSARRVSQVLAT